MRWKSRIVILMMIFGFPDKVFEWMGSDFIGFIEYLHDNYEEIRQTIENYESGDITFTIPLETYPDDRDPSNEKLFYTLDLRIQFHEHPHSTQNSYISAGFSIDSSFIGKEQEADKKAFGEIASIASLHSRSYGKKDGVRVD